MDDSCKRCDWCGEDPLYVAYHDNEWGVPERDDRRLFEFLILEGAQAGLSWLTVLRKRDHYRRAFDDFDAEKIARYDDEKRAQLLSDPGIIRNRLKIDSAINNARCYLDLRDQGESLSSYLWSFVDHKPIQNRFRTMAEIPAQTPVSERMSRTLKKRGFTFVGPTICYAHMQATGMVNDHILSCHRYEECARLADG